MDIGQGKNMANAKDLTAEIDRETDAMVRETLGQLEGIERNNIDGEMGLAGESVQGVGISAAQAQALGRGAIFGGYEVPGNGATAPEVAAPEATAETDDMMARPEIEAVAELSEDLNQIQHPERFVGDETAVQRQEYQRQDEEAVRRDEDKNGSWGAGVAFKNQEGVARYVATEAEKMVRQPKYELNGLTDLYRQGVRRTLATLDREIGARN